MSAHLYGPVFGDAAAAIDWLVGSEVFDLNAVVVEVDGGWQTQIALAEGDALVERLKNGQMAIAKLRGCASALALFRDFIAGDEEYTRMLPGLGRLVRESEECIADYDRIRAAGTLEVGTLAGAPFHSGGAR